MDENLAVLLGLGLGGIGGYFGSKNKRESEAERLAMLLDAQKPDPNVESDAIKLFKLQEAERKRIREENLLREQQAKADAEALDEEYYSLGDIFVDPFTDGISYDTLNKGKDFITNLGDSAIKKGVEASQAYDDFLGDRTLLQALGEEGEDFLFGNVDYEDLGKVFPVGNADEDFYIPGMQTTSPASNITNRQIANVGTDQDQMITNLAETAGGDTYLRGMPTDADQDFFIPPELIAQDNPNIPNFIEYLGGNEFFTPKGEKLYTDTSESLNNFYNTLLNIPSNIKDFAEYAGIFNQGGRVGLANGGLGYSYKNNIFSADPSTGIPAVVDAGGDDGVADDTFINLFPGLFPPVTDPVEKIMDTPAVPMGGGGPGGLDAQKEALGNAEGYKTFGDLMLDINNLPNMFGKPDPTDPFSTAYTGLDNIGEEEESSFFGLNLPNFADLPTPGNTFFNKLGEIRDFLSNAITNPDTDKGDGDKGVPKGPTGTQSGAGSMTDQQRTGVGSFRDPGSDRGNDNSGKNGKGPSGCFVEGTAVQMADGSTKEITSIEIGEETKGGTVQAKMEFMPQNIYNYKDVLVSGSHWVVEDNQFIAVEDSKHAILTDRIEPVYTFKTSDNRIWINDIEFGDFETGSDADWEPHFEAVRQKLNKQLDEKRR